MSTASVTASWAHSSSRMASSGAGSMGTTACRGGLPGGLATAISTAADRAVEPPQSISSPKSTWRSVRDPGGIRAVFASGSSTSKWSATSPTRRTSIGSVPALVVAMASRRLCHR